jgi:hypothetical protein
LTGSDYFHFWNVWCDTLKGLYRSIVKRIDPPPDVLVEYGSKKIMDKNDDLVLEYLIFCVFDQYSGYTLMNIYNFRTRAYS